MTCVVQTYKTGSFFRLLFCKVKIMRRDLITKDNSRANSLKAEFTRDDVFTVTFRNPCDPHDLSE